MVKFRKREGSTAPTNSDWWIGPWINCNFCGAGMELEVGDPVRVLANGTEAAFPCPTCRNDIKLLKHPPPTREQVARILYEERIAKLAARLPQDIVDRGWKVVHVGPAATHWFAPAIQVRLNREGYDYFGSVVTGKGSGDVDALYQAINEVRRQMQYTQG